MEALEGRDVPSTVTVTRAGDTVEGDVSTSSPVFAFARTGNVSGDLTVSFSIGGTATPGSDHSLSGTIFFPADTTLAIVYLHGADDTAAEPTETIVVTLLPGTGYTIGTANTATAYLFDNELPVVAVSATDTGEATATGGFSFTRLGDVRSALTVTYDVGGTATPTTDYRSLTGTVQFDAGQDRVEVWVEAFGDNTADDGETVIATLTGAGSSYTIDSTAGAATVTIADQPLTVSVERLSDGEEGAGNGVFRFTRAGDISAALTVSYSVGGTALSGSDFAALFGAVTFDADSAQTDVTVTVTNDTTNEPTETVVVTIDESSTYQLGNQSDTLFIRDNDTRRVYWISTSSTDWTLWSNWSIGAVPLATDDVYVSGSHLASISNAGSGLSSLAGLHILNGYAGTATLANALSVGTFEMTSGTLSQPLSTLTLTVTDALLWSGGTLNATDSGAVVNVSGATGVIDPPDTGAMAIASTLNVVSGAVVTLVSGTLDFIGGRGMYIDAAQLKAYVRDPNTKVRLENSGGSTSKKIEIDRDGELTVVRKNRNTWGGVDFNFPILNRGEFSIEDGIHFTVKGRVEGEANRPSIEHHSGLWLIGSGSNIIAEFGVSVIGGSFQVRALRENPNVGIKGDFKFSGGTFATRQGTALYAHLTVDGNLTWSGGTWRPRVDRDGFAPGTPLAGLPVNDRLIVRGTMTIVMGAAGASLEPIIPLPDDTMRTLNDWIIFQVHKLEDAFDSVNPPLIPEALRAKWEVDSRSMAGGGREWKLRRK